MTIKVTKLTNEDCIRDAASSTSGRISKISALKAYRSEHSIIRTQQFKIEMLDIPTFVSVHFVRHKIGVEHYVKSNREDRGGDANADRNTPVDHVMFANAQALINMSQVRMCNNAHIETRRIMEAIRDEVADIDPALAKFMVRKCIYRGGICGEPVCCQYNHSLFFEEELDHYKSLFNQ